MCTRYKPHRQLPADPAPATQTPQLKRTATDAAVSPLRMQLKVQVPAPLHVRQHLVRLACEPARARR